MTPPPAAPDLFQRVDMALLYPPFRDRVVEVVLYCRLSRQSDYWATRAWQSYLQQTRLYFQGRTLPGAIVTWAQGGESWHNFGLAVDFCADALLDVPKLQPSWRPESYVVLGEESIRAGLEWGGSWRRKDRPHVQWGGLTPALMRVVRRAYESEGLQACWDALAAATGEGKAVV